MQQVTTEWLSHALGTAVTSFTEERIGEGIGLLGDLHRLSLVLEDSSAGPSTIVAKFPTFEEVSRFTADALGYYPREIQFYTEHSDGAPFSTAHCYHAEIADDSSDFILLFEDLGDLTDADQLDGLTAAQALATVTAIATHHAQWWQHAELPAMASTFLPITADIYPLVLPDLFRSAWAATVEHMGEHLGDDGIRSFGDRYAEQLPWMLERVAEPMTWVHGDLRADNLFFATDGSPTIIDFQIMGQSVGVYDCAYLLSQSVPIDVRREHEDRIVRAYHQTLLDGGVAGYSFEQCWDDYRICLAFCLIYPVTAYDRLSELGNERGRELIDAMFLRSIAAISDTTAYELVPTSI